MKKSLLTLALFTALTAQATEMNISVELPEHQYEGRFYPPFVTAWVEKDKKIVDTLFIWYHFGNAEQTANTEWLKSLKKWWRRGGRKTDLESLDAVAGATKKPGTHTEIFKADSTTMQKLEQGVEYKLVFEASREKGANESIEFPFTLGAEEIVLEKTGESEFGNISVTITP